MDLISLPGVTHRHLSDHMSDMVENTLNDLKQSKVRIKGKKKIVGALLGDIWKKTRRAFIEISENSERHSCNIWHLLYFNIRSSQS